MPMLAEALRICCLLLVSATARGLRDTDDCIFPECNFGIEPTRDVKESNVPDSAITRNATIADAVGDGASTVSGAFFPVVGNSNSSYARLRESLPRAGVPTIHEARSRSPDRTASLATGRAPSMLDTEEHIAERTNTHQLSNEVLPNESSADGNHGAPSETLKARQAATRRLNVTAGELCPHGGAGDGCELGCYCRMGYACFIKHLSSHGTGGASQVGVNVGTCSPSLQVMVAGSVAIFFAGCIGLTLLRWTFEDYWDPPPCDPPVVPQQPATNLIHTT